MKLDSLEQLEEEILRCDRCPLRESATRPVPGHGNVGVKWMLIGEAPGREEDENGIPFIGASGRKLDKLMALAGISLNDCYLSNVCRCRPPENRTPKKKEIQACKEFLMREIRLVKPTCLITLGATPLGLFSTQGVTQTHGTSFVVEIPDA
jgi:DNA polymerase